MQNSQLPAGARVDQQPSSWKRPAQLEASAALGERELVMQAFVKHTHTSPGAQYGLIKEYTLNDVGILNII